MKRTILTVGAESEAGTRLDKYLSEVARLFTRSQLKRRVVEVRVNDTPAKLSHRLASGDTVEVVYADEETPTVVAEEMSLDILFEDDNVIVVNKPAGMVVHPAAGNWSGTLVQGLAFHIGRLRDQLGVTNIRPGIVHRLDKDTSGVIIAAKNPESQEALARQFRRKSTEKSYVALVKGRVFPIASTIETCIRRDPVHRKRFEATPDSGKPSITDYRVLRQWERHAFVSLKPRTGRTHQLRVHMASIGHPILGDPIYSRPDPDFPEAPLMLHAHRLSITLPSRERVTFRAPLPQRFKRLLVEIARRESR